MSLERMFTELAANGYTDVRLHCLLTAHPEASNRWTSVAWSKAHKEVWGTGRTGEESLALVLNRIPGSDEE